MEKYWHEINEILQVSQRVYPELKEILSQQRSTTRRAITVAEINRIKLKNLSLPPYSTDLPLLKFKLPRCQRKRIFMLLIEKSADRS